MEFSPTHLYIKQHSITGMKYFGKTTKDPIKYLGSGKYWLNHIKFHDKSKVVTTWSKLFTDRDDLIEFATFVSEELNIVDSPNWANLTIETGIDGGARLNNHCKIINKSPRSEKWKLSISKIKSGNRYATKPIQIGELKFDAMIDASKHFNVTEQTIYNWIKKGKAILRS